MRFLQFSVSLHKFLGNSASFCIFLCTFYIRIVQHKHPYQLCEATFLKTLHPAALKRIVSHYYGGRESEWLTWAVSTGCGTNAAWACTCCGPQIMPRGMSPKLKQGVMRSRCLGRRHSQTGECWSGGPYCSWPCSPPSRNRTLSTARTVGQHTAQRVHLYGQGLNHSAGGTFVWPGVDPQRRGYICMARGWPTVQGVHLYGQGLTHSAGGTCVASTDIEGVQSFVWPLRD